MVKGEDTDARGRILDLRIIICEARAEKRWCHGGWCSLLRCGGNLFETEFFVVVLIEVRALLRGLNVIFSVSY